MHYSFVSLTLLLTATQTLASPTLTIEHTNADFTFKSIPRPAVDDPATKAVRPKGIQAYVVLPIDSRPRPLLGVWPGSNVVSLVSSLLLAYRVFKNGYF